jgi:3-dehydroquinate synthase
MLIIRSHAHDYFVETFASLAKALEGLTDARGALYLLDSEIERIYRNEITASMPESCRVVIEATEEQKSYERLVPIFLELLSKGLKRDGVLIVVGGGVLQDIGCFIATVLFRGVRWELVPTTLLAQADSCIGSKSSINIGNYKNQIGTFYPPHRVMVSSDILRSLPWDEIRSGLGEVIKLQLIAGQAGFDELMADLKDLNPNGGMEVISKWVERSMAVKKPYIEEDEFDRGIRNLLNYGHTFGHAYESATRYAIPHGIAVIIGILTATYVSVRLGLIDENHFLDLKQGLTPWFHPYEKILLTAPKDDIFKAIRHDKKNTGDSVNCILTSGPGRMKKRKVDFFGELVPAVEAFLNKELATPAI